MVDISNQLHKSNSPPYLELQNIFEQIWKPTEAFPFCKEFLCRFLLTIPHMMELNSKAKITFILTLNVDVERPWIFVMLG